MNFGGGADRRLGGLAGLDTWLSTDMASLISTVAPAARASATSP